MRDSSLLGVERHEICDPRCDLGVRGFAAEFAQRLQERLLELRDGRKRSHGREATPARALTSSTHRATDSRDRGANLFEVCPAQTRKAGQPCSPRRSAPDSAASCARAWDPAVRLTGDHLGVAGDRWVQPVLDANHTHLKRLDIRTTVDVRSGVSLRLTPGPRIGAVPLLSPATRRVVAGLLVAPRFRWSALGAVLGDTGFATEPSLGGSALVPGSAREVPTWLLAAPVVRRLEGMLAHRKRGFVERSEHRQSPRGRVDWNRWATRDVPARRWSTLPCHFPDPDDDPALLAAVRWTLGRLDDDLAPLGEATAARRLRVRVADLQARVGPGPARRPASWDAPASSAWITDALQAMGWVAEERGLGGARSLDGMSWDLRIDELWETWVDAFVATLAPRCGLVAMRRGHTTRGLHWTPPVTSMRALIPDSGLRSPERVVWIDAKYKAHLQLLTHHGWTGLGDSVRDAHRADLHQALAYAALDDHTRVDSMLVYPQLSEDHAPVGIASIAAGRRRVRLMLVGLPFGFRSGEHRDATVARWRELLAG